jgi:hypothetical protein
MEDLQDPPTGGDVELVVQRPHVVGSLGDEPVSWGGGLSDPAAFASFGGHPQPFLAP